MQFGQSLVYPCRLLSSVVFVLRKDHTPTETTVNIEVGEYNSGITYEHYALGLYELWTLSIEARVLRGTAIMMQID